MNSTYQRALLLLRTVQHLTVGQVVARFRLRAQRGVYKRVGSLGRLLHPAKFGAAPGWPASFEPLQASQRQGFPAAEKNADGTFVFLNQERSLGSPPDWTQGAASQLWRYHLHYFEWAWSFCRMGGSGAGVWEPAEQFLRLWSSWRKCTPLGIWDGWSPYVASVRAWSLCGVYAELVAGSPLEREYKEDLARHLSYLRANLETDVGGNHLVKNLKALVGLGVFFADASVVESALRRLCTELSVQVLADGGHFERSPSYHCQVLEDLVDVEGLIISAGWSPPRELSLAITNMRRWLGALPVANGDLPRLNDSFPVGARARALCASGLESQPIVILASSGYVVLRPNPRVSLVADIGLPCPPQLPAHAHADCLSFELYLDGVGVVVDTGTSTYEPGHRRQYERSTAAHNTVELDGVDQTEVWATFRAARLASASLEGVWEEAGDLVLVGSHDGYQRLPGGPTHRRTWRLSSERLTVIDEIIGEGSHRVRSHFHLPVGGEVDYLEGLAVRVEPGDYRAEPCELAVDFGIRQPGVVLVMENEVALPFRSVAEFDLQTLLKTGSDRAEGDLEELVEED